MQIVTTHKNTDFDAFASLIAATVIHPGAIPVLPKQINPNIKVLLSSGYSIDGQATEILERGCNGFIQKPFNMNELAKQIRKIME